jgi:Ca-activated chloride channel homolog
MFRWGFQQGLWFLLLVPVLVLFFIWAFRQKRKSLERFGRWALVERLARSVSRKRLVLKAGLLVSAVAFLTLALARPQLGTKLETVKREGQDIVIALDVSLSMKAQDIQPTRLDKAKHEIASLIDKLQGDRIALVAFSGKAFVQCPLTLDYGAVKMFLETLDTDLIPVPGTAVTEAIQKSAAAFVEKERKHKVVLLITDGESHEGDAVEAAKTAAKEGVVIYTVGIGSPQGVPIPITNPNGVMTEFKKDRDGEVVMTKLDELTLEKIALETGGKYYRATSGEMELNKIYDDILKMDKKTLASQQFEQYEDRFQALIVLAFFLLILELVIPERRKWKGEWKGRFE